MYLDGNFMLMSSDISGALPPKYEKIQEVFYHEKNGSYYYWTIFQRN